MLKKTLGLHSKKEKKEKREEEVRRERERKRTSVILGEKGLPP
jgi:hypothetical protein